MRIEEYSEAVPTRTATSSKLVPWKAEIEQWLEEDRRVMSGFLELVCAPYEAQAYFGEADVIKAGRFKCQYEFSVSFCNPESGHEKGHVENKVGYVRRNFFVPIPVIPNLSEWNRELLDVSERDIHRLHYKKGQLIRELFDHDRKALGPLPATSFSVERLEQVRTDGYGKFCIDARHWYSSAPELAHRSVMVGIGAHTARMTFDGLVGVPDSGPDLSAYDRAFMTFKDGGQ